MSDYQRVEATARHGRETARAFWRPDTGRVLGLSALLLIPCFWQPHIQAGDLASHLYNAWLASEIQQGRIEDFVLVPVWTNVLTDWIMTTAVARVGVSAAERLVVAPAVLIFFWGAFFLMKAAAGVQPWRFTPLLALFTYGLVFHLGFLNFYVSTGLCLWILGLLWTPTPGRVAAAVAIAVVALVAHPLPVVWATAVFAYVRAFTAMPGRWRAGVPLLALAVIAGVSALLRIFPHRWSWAQTFSLEGIASLTAVEQIWLFDAKYFLIAAVLAVAFFILLADRLVRPGALLDPWFHVWILHLLGLAILPAAVQLPQYDHPLAYVTQRLSLFTGLMFCVMLRTVRISREAILMSSAVAVAYFSFLYLDHRAFNAIEADVTAVVATAPARARVVAVVVDAGARVNGLAHAADRACIGHCFSYANYEPASRQFRVRLADGNRLSVPTVAAAQAIDRGEHVVSAAEDPIHAVCACEPGTRRLCLRVLHAGERVCRAEAPISVRLWNETASRVHE